MVPREAMEEATANLYAGTLTRLSESRPKSIVSFGDGQLHDSNVSFFFGIAHARMIAFWRYVHSSVELEIEMAFDIITIFSAFVAGWARKCLQVESSTQIHGRRFIGENGICRKRGKRTHTKKSRNEELHPLCSRLSKVSVLGRALRNLFPRVDVATTASIFPFLVSSIAWWFLARRWPEFQTF